MPNYMVKAWDIVAYTFNADVYCPDHIGDAVASHPQYEGWRLVGEHRKMGAEANLDEIAAHYQIDRENEHSFDSGDFPKVIFASDLEGPEYCGAGHNFNEEN